jgi:hypothetical protein
VGRILAGTVAEVYFPVLITSEVEYLQLKIMLEGKDNVACALVPLGFS